MSRAKSLLAKSEVALAEPIGELAEPFRAHAAGSEPSDVEKLIGAAITESLQQRGMRVDGVMHGSFDPEHDLPAGRKTVRDIWKILPFENYVVTGELTADEIRSVMDEVFQNHENRALVGFAIRAEGSGADRRITSLTLGDGRPLERSRKYLLPSTRSILAAQATA